MRLLAVITNLGDLALLVPLSVVLLLWLVGMRARRGALWWVVALMLCMGGTALLKIYFYECPPLPELRSPSGHTSLSTLVYGAIIVIVGAKYPSWQRWLTVLCGGALILAISWSRIALGAHSTIETTLGLAIGGTCLAAFAFGYLSRSPTQARIRPLLLVVTLLVIGLHGQEVRAEEFLHAIGGYLHSSAIGCMKR